MSPLASIGPDPSRSIALDVLRGVAILLVLFTHNLIEPSAAGSLGPTLAYLRYLGPSGVDLFFVLSGFLIGGLLFREIDTTHRLDVGRFLVRRVFRIWPSYFAFVAFMFAWLVLVERKGAGDGLGVLLPNLLHVQNYLGSWREHTWSLAVEEHFYLALPFLLVLLLPGSAASSNRIPSLPLVAVAVLAACALLRLQATGQPLPFNPHFATHLRMDSLFFGVLLAYLHQFEPHRLRFAERHRGLLLALGATLLLLYPAFVMSRSFLVPTLGFPMLYVAYGCFVLALTHGSAPRLGGLFARAVAFIGYFSYPMYLWHIEATRLVARLLPSSLALSPELRWACSYGLYVGIVLAVAVLVAILVDKPLLALRDRLFPSRAQGARGAEGPTAG